MAEIAFISNKTRKEASKYIFVIVFAVITWILQVSVFNSILFFDAAPNLILLGTVYLGLVFGPSFGAIYGIASSFLCASILFDHIFYFSYPLLGLIAGFLTKNIFTDELLFYITVVFVFTFLLEYLNGFQLSLLNSLNIYRHYFLIVFSGGLVNLFLALFFYLFMGFVTRKLKIR